MSYLTSHCSHAPHAIDGDLGAGGWWFVKASAHSERPSRPRQAVRWCGELSPFS